MKEIAMTARNIMLSCPDQGDPSPMIEAILVVSEPTFRIDQGGGIIRQRELETVRFHSTPNGLRKVAIAFAEWADEAEAIGPKKPEAEQAGAGESPGKTSAAFFAVATMIRDAANRYQDSHLEKDREELERLTGLFNLPPAAMISAVEREFGYTLKG